MSTLSPVGICRRALQRVGVTKTIASIEDPKSTEEILCADCYDDQRLALLRAHPWNFAKKRVEIAAELDSPEFEYEYKYRLPADFVKLVQIGEYPFDRKTIKYTIEDGFILARNNTSDTSGVLKIVYVSNVTDVGLMDSLFRELLRLKIAHTIAYPLTKKNTLVDAIAKEVLEMMPTSKSADGQDGGVERIEVSRVIDERYQGRRGLANDNVAYYFNGGR